MTANFVSSMIFLPEILHAKFEAQQHANRKSNQFLVYNVMNTDRSITTLHPPRVCLQRYIKSPTVPSHLPGHTSIHGNSKYEAKREPPFCFDDPHR